MLTFKIQDDNLLIHIKLNKNSTEQRNTRHTTLVSNIWEIRREW